MTHQYFRPMKAVSTIVLLSLSFLLYLLYAAAPASAASSPPPVTAASVIMIDGGTGEVLYQKNPSQQRAVASTTKIMTGLLALESGNLDSQVTASKAVTLAGGSSLYLSVGDKMSRRDLLWALMLRSANDGAVALAESMSGSVPAFSKLMNKRAKELGAKNTHFNNPNGMPDPNHWSTAYDLSLIARHAMQNPDFRGIVKTWSHQLSPVKGKPGTVVTSHNRLLKKYPYTTGIKTGFTNKAGHCLVSAAKKGDTELILVVLGGKSANIVYDESKALFEWGFSQYTERELLAEGSTIAKLPIKEKKGETLELVAAENVSSSVPATASPKVIAAPTAEFKLPIAEGQKMGDAIVMVGDQRVAEIPLIASREIKAPSLVSKATGAPKGMIDAIASFIAGIF